MITKKLFDKIQIALRDNGKPRKKEKVKDFKFLGLARCGECGYAITAEKQVKKSGLEFIYYHCTYKSKAHRCSQRKYTSEKDLASQIKSLCQKVSLPDVWRDKYLAKLDKREDDSLKSSDLFAQKVKREIDSIKAKINRLTDAYLNEALELNEYQEKKNELVDKKKTLEERLTDFERKGNRWLKLTRNWIIEANQARNIALKEDYVGMKKFLKRIGLNRQITGGKLEIRLPKPWQKLEEIPISVQSSGTNTELNPIMWRLLNEVITHFKENPDSDPDSGF